MLRNAGACLDCVKFTTWWTTRRRDRWLRPCETCGGELAAPGSREYAIVEFHIRSRAIASAIALPVWTPPASRAQTPYWRDLVRIASENNYKRAREVAHDARSLYRYLRFEFDVDIDGRPV